MGQEIKKTMKGKIVFKHETEANWAQSNYVPDNGEMVIYDIDSSHNYKRVKYGDGETKVKDLPFGGATFDDSVKIKGDLTITAGGEKETIIRNNAIYTDGMIQAMDVIHSNNSLIGKSLQVQNNIILNEGVAEGNTSIAGGTTDINLIKSVLGDGYAALIEKYGNINNMPDIVLNLLLSTADVGYTLEEFKRILNISPATAEALLAISLGASNKSTSTASMSLGYGNISGAKGYYVTEINTADKSITLSTTQDTTTSPETGAQWESGDRLFIVNDDRYWVEVDQVRDGGRTVVLKDLPFTSLAELKTVTIPLDATYNITNPAERSVINIDKPENGEVGFGWGAIGIGALNTILGSNSLGVGYKNLIAGDFGTAFGQENEVGYSAFAAGIKNMAVEKGSVALGNEAEAIGKYSHAKNYRTRAEGEASNSQGYRSKAIGDYSDATGYKTTTLGENSSSAGESTNRFTDAGVNGRSTIDEINAAWAGKKFSVAKGRSSHVGGKDCLAFGDYSFADGEYTKATGGHSRSTGLWTEALGKHSYAGGDSSKAKHDDSFVHGRKLSTSRDCQVVFGEDNVDNPDALLIVGKNDYPNGNAFEVCQDGSVKINNHTLEAKDSKLIFNGEQVATGIFTNLLETNTLMEYGSDSSWQEYLGTSASNFFNPNYTLNLQNIFGRNDGSVYMIKFCSPYSVGGACAFIMNADGAVSNSVKIRGDYGDYYEARFGINRGILYAECGDSIQIMGIYKMA